MQACAGKTASRSCAPRKKSNQNLYYVWSKDFLEAGKKRLTGDTVREATSDEIKGLRAKTHQLKELLAELLMENRVLMLEIIRLVEQSFGFDFDPQRGSVLG